MASEQQKRKVRSIRLTVGMDDRLVALCKHLGTNPNSYMLNELGKCVARDELTFKLHENQTEMLNKVAAAFDGIVDESKK